jgi:CARDB protein
MLTRIALISLAIAAVTAPAAHAAVPKSARAVSLTACERDTGAGDGAAVFEARMRLLPRTSRMQMRFTLQGRTPGRDRYAAITAPGFGSWVSADPGTSRYVYTKRVENLLAPASYRVKLRFRWLNAAGKVVQRAKAFSAACRQPDPRPDLTVRSIGVQSVADPARRRYVAFVRNTGRGVAGPSSLELIVAGTLLGSVLVAELEPGEGALVSIEAPACEEGDPVLAEADADEAVDESDEADNRFSRSC